MADLPQGFKRTHDSTEFHEIHLLSSPWLIFLFIAGCLSISHGPLHDDQSKHIFQLDQDELGGANLAYAKLPAVSQPRQRLSSHKRIFNLPEIESLENRFQ